jgi:putative methionine-R-sulfoxide reductase with GAF domain
MDGSGTLIAVLDIDASTPSTFDEEDQRGLERLAAWVRRSGHMIT